jgi:hypothetical protein
MSFRGLKWCARQESNLLPQPSQGCALSSELRARVGWPAQYTGRSGLASHPRRIAWEAWHDAIFQYQHVPGPNVG